MKTITWQVAFKDDKIIQMEKTNELPSDKIESHLEIIGVLEKLIQKHLEKIEKLYEQSKKL